MREELRIASRLRLTNLATTEDNFAAVVEDSSVVVEVAYIVNIAEHEA